VAQDPAALKRFRRELVEAAPYWRQWPSCWALPSSWIPRKMFIS